MEIKMTDDQRNTMWRNRLDQLTASGMTQKAWCQENNVAESTLRYWIRKLQPAAETDKSSWIQIPENEASCRQKGDLTVICSGIEINITADADPALRSRIIKAMIDI